MRFDLGATTKGNAGVFVTIIVGLDSETTCRQVTLTDIKAVGFVARSVDGIPLTGIAT